MSTFEPSSSRKRAFTLIELLVVVAIISLLAAILFPVFASVRSKARQTVCLSNLRQLGMTFLQYSGDNDSYPTPPFSTRGVKTGYPGWWYGTSTTATATDSGATPGSERPGDIYWPDSPLAAYNPSYQLIDCPEAPHPQDPRLQYLYSKKIPGFGYGCNQTVFNAKKVISAYDKPDETVMLADAGWYNWGGIRGSFYVYGPTNVKTAATDPSAQDYGKWDDDGVWANQSGGIRGHTNGFTNVLWVDGHVRPMKLTFRTGFNPDNPHAKLLLGDLVHPAFPYELRGQPMDANGWTGDQKLNYYFGLTHPPLPATP